MAALAPEHPRALAILGRVREEGGGYDQAVALYERAASKEPDRSEQSALLTRAAVVLMEHGHDEDRAADLLVRALAADPGHRDANERLVDVYTRREQWADVEALLDREVQSAQPPETRATRQTPSAWPRCRRSWRAPRWRWENRRRRSIAWRARTACGPELLPMLRTFADFRYGRGEWKEAIALYESLLALHRASLPFGEIPDLFLRVGRGKGEVGDPEGAIVAYREAAALAPSSRAAREALAPLLAAKEDWAGWIAEREALAAVVAEPETGPALGGDRRRLRGAPR